MQKNTPSSKLAFADFCFYSKKEGLRKSSFKELCMKAISLQLCASAFPSFPHQILALHCESAARIIGNAESLHHAMVCATDSHQLWLFSSEKRWSLLISVLQHSCGWGLGMTISPWLLQLKKKVTFVTSDQALHDSCCLQWWGENAHVQCCSMLDFCLLEFFRGRWREGGTEMWFP